MRGSYKMTKYNIPFSPPDIRDEEINAVTEVLKSGWITSGPKVAQFEKDLANYCDSEKAVAVSSATAGMELVLKVMNIGIGDEVITTPYTYTATSNVLLHRGIMPTFVDVKKDDFLIDAEKIEKAITDKTKAIMPVDFAGVPVDYDEIYDMLKRKGREDIIIISDSAHSLGATYKGKKLGSQCDFHVFSFHAVKNLTTAEGGAFTFSKRSTLYNEFKYTSLQGQSKDAFSKAKAGAWKYDVVTDGFKSNMTDIQAAIGIAQLNRYEEMISKRKSLFSIYNKYFSNKEWAILPFQKNKDKETSYHLYPLRIKGFSEAQRDEAITTLANMGIAVNVHFIPLPMFTLYKKLGYNILDYPNAYAMYSNEITIPLYSVLTLENAEIVATEVINVVDNILKGGSKL